VADVINRVSDQVPGATLRVFGRGSSEAENILRSSPYMESIAVLGVLEPVDIARELARSDVLLFVRGPASSRRGTIVAAIANGVPVVAAEGPETGPAIRSAGVLLFPDGDAAAAADGLIRIARDPAFADSLRRRQRESFDRTFSWRQIAATVEAVA
jgi:glycosyltransferase involved in cell wall biosynthesis